MENDFINFKNKENKDTNTLPLIQSLNTRTEPSLAAPQTKRNTITQQLHSTSSTKMLLVNKQNDKLKDFLFNPDQQGKGRCYDIPDPSTCQMPGLRDSRSSGARVRFTDYMIKRAGDRRSQLLMPDISLSLGSGNGSILKSLVNNNKRFSINQSRHTIKQFLGALDAYTKQSKNKAVNTNMLL